MGFHAPSLIRGLALALALPLAAGAPRAPKAPKAPAHAINLNTATATELTQLPHIGEKTADEGISES